MNVTIIRTGNMARGIGTRLVAGGNSVTVAGRDMQEAAELAGELQTAAKSGAKILIVRRHLCRPPPAESRTKIR